MNIREFNSDIVHPFFRSLVPFSPLIVFLTAIVAFAISVDKSIGFIPALLLCIAILSAFLLFVAIFFALVVLGMWLEEKLFPND